ncbi:exopolysaccharide biosynthesis protein [Lactobacillus amylovorus]|uniref:YveK family protein n=1 Tax=Lactobacillus amylovorus TaxID=1604 RepID=UPI001F593DC1|nr:Wzz/FepE/Etk N-terminal domain-containing protein [Lactobacillus amylovorus]UNL46177.1 exopolysaccharide biosynthesis protein [Lactobacillus amylovorus]
MEQEQKQTDSTIDLTQLLRLCRRHIWALILWSVGLALVGWGIANFVISPKYTSSAQILVNPKSNKNDPNAVYTTQQANMQLVNTYKDIVTSHVILKDASDRLINPVRVVKKAKPAKYKTTDGRKVLVRKAQPAVIERDGKAYSVSAAQLAKSVSVATQQQSQVFSVSATADTPEKAKAEANAVARSFRDQIPNIMNINNVTILAPATNGVQSSPNVKMFTLAGFVIGLVLTLAVILIREMTNTTVRDDTYLTQDLGLTNLGYVSHFHVSSSFKLINNNKPAAKREQRKRRRV